MNRRHCVMSRGPTATKRARRTDMKSHVENGKGIELARVAGDKPVVKTNGNATSSVTRRAKGLKLLVPRDELVSAIRQAGIAAATHEGQSALAAATNPTVRCVKIVADDAGIRIESAVAGFSSMYAMKSGRGNRVIRTGVICVPYKELKVACARLPKGCHVSLTFLPDAKYGVATANPVSAMASTWSGRPNGVVEVGLSGDGASVCVRIECYSPDRFRCTDYPDASQLSVLMSGRMGSVKNACEMVAFAANRNCAREKYDKIAVLGADSSVCFMASDGKRCVSATRIPAFFDTWSKPDVPVLILVDHLMPILKATPDDDFMLAIGGDQANVYLYCGKSRYRFSLPDLATRAKHPNPACLLNMPLGAVFLIDRKSLATALGIASLANKEKCVLTFSDNGTLGIGTEGLGAAKAIHASARCRLISGPQLKKPSALVNLRHLSDCVSRLTSDSASVSFSTDELRIRIEDETDPQFAYFMQRDMRITQTVSCLGKTQLGMNMTTTTATPVITR